AGRAVHLRPRLGHRLHRPASQLRQPRPHRPACRPPDRAAAGLQYIAPGPGAGGAAGGARPDGRFRSQERLPADPGRYRLHPRWPQQSAGSGAQQPGAAGLRPAGRHPGAQPLAGAGPAVRPADRGAAAAPGCALPELPLPWDGQAVGGPVAAAEFGLPRRRAAARRRRHPRAGGSRRHQPHHRVALLTMKTIACSRRQRGIALITALLVVAIATLLAVEMASRERLDIRRTQNLIAGDQAYDLALAAESWALDILRADLEEGNEWDGMQDNWAQPILLPPFEGAILNMRIEDLQGRFNLNNLANLPQDPQQA